MNNKKKILIILIVLVLLIMIIIFSLGNKNNSDNNNEIVEIGDVGEIIDYDKMILEPLSNRYRYYTIKSCVSQYLDTINLDSSAYYGYDNNNNYVLITDKNTIKKNIYSMLSKEYIEKNKVTTENVLDHVEELNQSVKFIPIKANVLIQQDIEKYVVYGIQTDINNKYIKDFYVIVSIDLNNKTFSIEPINQQYKDIDEIKITNNNEEIAKKDNNIYMDIPMKDQDFCKEYINRYKELCLAKPELAYEYLDKEYRKKRFGSADKFKLYIAENKNEVSTMQCAKYYVEDYGTHTKYIIKDQYDKQYIITAKTGMDFSIILDTYTIELPEFTEKYNSGNDQLKVGMNIEKILEAIESKDYEYVYSKLDTTFKNNNFKTLDLLKKYVNNKFYKYNEVKYTKFTKHGETYVYELKVKERNNEKSPEKDLTIIMKLLEGTDFVMSFNIK